MVSAPLRGSLAPDLPGKIRAPNKTLSSWRKPTEQGHRSRIGRSLPSHNDGRNSRSFQDHLDDKPRCNSHNSGCNGQRHRSSRRDKTSCSSRSDLDRSGYRHSGCHSESFLSGKAPAGQEVRGGGAQEGERVLRLNSNREGGTRRACVLLARWVGLPGGSIRQERVRRACCLGGGVLLEGRREASLRSFFHLGAVSRFAFRGREERLRGRLHAERRKEGTLQGPRGIFSLRNSPRELRERSLVFPRDKVLFVGSQRNSLGTKVKHPCANAIKGLFESLLFIEPLRDGVIRTRRASNKTVARRSNVLASLGSLLRGPVFC